VSGVLAQPPRAYAGERGRRAGGHRRPQPPEALEVMHPPVYQREIELVVPLREAGGLYLMVLLDRRDHVGHGQPTGLQRLTVEMDLELPPLPALNLNL